MPKSKSVLSGPVQASIDELMAELVRRYSEEEVADVLRVGVKNATSRLRRDRHERYKAECFFRRATTRLVKVPEDLQALVGIPHKDRVLPRQTSMPLFEAKPAEPTEGTSEEETANAIESADPPDSEDGFDQDVDVDAGTLFSPITFEDVKSVFNTYPFAMWYGDPHEGRLLILGYASLRQGGPSSPLIRQNCSLIRPDGTEIVFRDIQGGLYPRMEQKSDAIHMHIKALPFPNGSGIRFWTNIEGSGDDQTKYRFYFCDNDCLFPVVSKQALMTCILKHQKTAQQALPA